MAQSERPFGRAGRHRSYNLLRERHPRSCTSYQQDLGIPTQRVSIRGGDLGLGSLDLSQIVHLAGLSQGTVLGGDTGLDRGRAAVPAEGFPAFEVLCGSGAGSG